MSHLESVTEDEVSRLRGQLAAAESRYKEQAALARAREREVLALRRVALATNGSLELGEMLTTIVQAALELTGSDRAHVVWRDEEELDRLLANHHGDASWRLTNEAMHKIEGGKRALESGETAILEDPTLVCLPLVAPGRVLGALCVGGPMPDQNALADLQVLAAHAAGALENAVLFTALRRRSTELEATLVRFEQAELDAHTDPLTQVPNKRQFREQGRREEAAAKRYGRPFSLIMMDIDHFKAVNDTHGHLVGDKVLKAVAATLAGHVRGADLLARWGGEEFVALCPMTTRHEAMKLAERLRVSIEGLAANDETGARLPALTISLGVATFSGKDDPLDSVLERADKAMLSAKAAGRNQIKVDI
jgi:diguanylate cyclase (GGDEF)-like protein